MNDRNSTLLTERTTLDRRRLLRAGSATAGAATLLAGSELAHAVERTADELVFYVALDGRTFRMVRADQTDPHAPPTLGDTFVMYGTIFPAGTLDQGSFNPDHPGGTGRWICRGAFNVDLTSGAVPHAVSTVLHILGEGLSVGDGDVAQAADAIIHEGLESGVSVIRRGVVGGYGMYAGARGDVVQEYRGDNETLIQITPEIAMPAPNYTFTFNLTG